LRGRKVNFIYQFPNVYKIIFSNRSFTLNPSPKERGTIGFLHKSKSFSFGEGFRMRRLI
jgi:hypothetical protein